MASDGSMTEIVSTEDSWKESQRACGLCLKEKGKYTCPRCNVYYCSMTCYRGQKHQECSESFYQKCVMNHIGGSHVTEDDKRKMLEMLANMQGGQDKDQLVGEGLDSDQSLSGDDEEEADSEMVAMREALSNEDPDELWERLTTNEKADFEKALLDGRLGHMISIWTPWWEDSQSEETMPLSVDELPHFTVILPNRSPAKELPYNLLDLLYTYVYTIRLYNGDPLALPVEACNTIGRASSVLGANQIHDSPEHAMHVCMQRAGQDMGPSAATARHTVSLCDDVHSLLSDPSRPLKALVDLYHLLNTALPEMIRSEPHKNQCSLLQADKQSTILLDENHRGGKRPLGPKKKKPMDDRLVSKGDQSKDKVRTGGHTRERVRVEREMVCNRKTVKACLKKVEFYIAWYSWRLEDLHLDTMRMLAQLSTSIQSESERLKQDHAEVGKTTTQPILLQQDQSRLVETVANQISEKKLVLPNGEKPRNLIEEL